MRVIFIPDEAEIGGATMSLKEMILNLSKNYNVEPIILTSKKSEMTKFAQKNGFETYDIGYRAFYISKGSTQLKKFLKTLLLPFLYLNYKLANIKAIKLAEKYVDFSKIDLIHSNVNRNDIGALLAQKYTIPHIWHIREFGDLDYECISLRRNYTKFMNSYTTKFIAISKAVANHWINKGIDKDKIVVVYNGIDENKFCVKECNSDKVRIVFSGYISPNKGQIEAINAISVLDNNIKDRITLDIYGNGAKEYIVQLKKIIKENSLDDIISFKGYSEQLYNEIPNYDVGLVCSKSEGFGRVTVEYMLSKLCVIASNTGANTELIDNGVTGLLYEYGDKYSLAQKITYLIENDNKIKQIANNGYYNALNNYTSNINTKNVYSIYSEILNEK